MPVTATPTNNPTAPSITADDIRWFLRDYADNNILLDKVQFTNDEMAKAMEFAVDEYNVVTPISSDSSASIPKSLLLLGTSSWLMKSESFLQLRNQATYQDADIAPIGIDDKHQLYFALAGRLKEEWQMSVKSYKQQRNMEGTYGALSSGYRNTGRFHNN